MLHCGSSVMSNFVVDDVGGKRHFEEQTGLGLPLLPPGERRGGPIDASPGEQFGVVASHQGRSTPELSSPEAKALEQGPGGGVQLEGSCGQKAAPQLQKR